MYSHKFSSSHNRNNKGKERRRGNQFKALFVLVLVVLLLVEEGLVVVFVVNSGVLWSCSELCAGKPPVYLYFSKDLSSTNNCGDSHAF